MKSNRKVVERTVANALSGKASHVATKSLFAGLDWQVAGSRPEGVPHSVFQLLNHMSYWQDWVVKRLEGEDPPVPEHAEGGWPGGPSPESPQEWQRAVRGFRSGLLKLDRRSREADLLA